MQEVEVQNGQTSEKQSVKAVKKIKVEKKTVIAGVAAFTLGFLAGFGSVFGVSKIKTSKKK